MTHNNISYLEMLERKRSNLAQETETARANRAKEANTVFVAQLEDAAKRDIAAMEVAGKQAIAEMETAAKRDIAQQDVETRLVTAGLSKESAATVAQINAGASAYASKVNAETQRYIADLNYTHDENVLAEQTRHDIVTEDIGQTQNVINSMREEHDYEIGLRQVEETETHDQATENYQSAKAAEDYVLGVGNIIARLIPGLGGLFAP